MASVFRTGRGRREAGYTMAELLIVLLIVGLIAALAVPNIGGAVKRAEETALRENLAVMRKALDDYIADRGAGPDDLSDLVDQNYVRFIPDDPVAGPDTPWRLVTDDQGDIVDIRSGSDERGSNETPYSEW